MKTFGFFAVQNLRNNSKYMISCGVFIYTITTFTGAKFATNANPIGYDDKN